MSLEDVKVGDRVWVVDQSFSGVENRRLLTVTSVTPTLIRSGKEQWRRTQGAGRRQRVGAYVGWDSFGRLESVATADEIAEYEAGRIAKQADAESAEREREKAREEKRERLIKLVKTLRLSLGTTSSNEGYAEFEFLGFCYRIEEVAAHREE